MYEDGNRSDRFKYLLTHALTNTVSPIISIYFYYCRKRKDARRKAGRPRANLISKRLLDAVEAGLDRREGVLDRGADLADDGDDEHADEGGDQAVLDGGGAGLALRKAGEKVLHDWILHTLTDLRSRAPVGPR